MLFILLLLLGCLGAAPTGMNKGTGHGSLSLDRGTTEFWTAEGDIMGVAYVDDGAADITYEYKLLITGFSPIGGSARAEDYPAVVPLATDTGRAAQPQTPVHLLHHPPGTGPFQDLDAFEVGAWQFLEDKANDGSTQPERALWVRTVVKWYDICDWDAFSTYPHAERTPENEWVDDLGPDAARVGGSYAETSYGTGRYIHQKHDHKTWVKNHSPLKMGASADLNAWIDQIPEGEQIAYSKAWVVKPLQLNKGDPLDAKRAAWPGSAPGVIAGTAPYISKDIDLSSCP